MDTSEKSRSTILNERRTEKTMRILLALFVLAVGLRVVPAGNNEDVGTVIGIDLGTTYSWYVDNHIWDCFFSNFVAFYV